MRKMLSLAAAALLLASCATTPSGGDPQLTVYNAGQQWLNALGFAGEVAQLTPLPPKVCGGLRAFETAYEGASRTVRDPAFQSGDKAQQAAVIATNGITTVLSVIAQLALSAKRSAPHPTHPTITADPFPADWDAQHAQIIAAFAATRC